MKEHMDTNSKVVIVSTYTCVMDNTLYELSEILRRISNLRMADVMYSGRTLNIIIEVS